MPHKARVLAIIGPALAWSLLSAVASGGTITQEATIPLSPTNWGPTNNGLNGSDPLSFQKFDNKGGSLILDSVQVQMHGIIQNNYDMQFVTPATITTSVATGNPSNPGPSVTLFQPDGVTPVLTVQATDPNQLTRSVTYGFGSTEKLPQEFSSNLPTNSPFYLAPQVTAQTLFKTITDPTSLAQFVGSGSVIVPVAANAVSSFQSSSGNGMGQVTTNGEADVTISYTYHQAAPEFVPEPASLLAWGAGGVALLFARRIRRRVA